MNSLSWIIYFAYLVGSFGFLVKTLVFVFAAGCFIRFIYMCYCNDSKKEFTYFSKNFKWLMTGMVALVLIHTVVPDRRTVIMIAASEIGEQVVKSEEVTKIIDPSLELLQTWMRAETDRLRGNTTPKTEGN